MDGLNALEARFLYRLGETLSSGPLDGAAKVLSRLGDAGIIFILLAAALLCFRKTRGLGIVLAIGLVLDLLVINVTLKPLISRVRPYEYLDIIQIVIAPPSGHSFPSGHTAAAFAAAGALSYAGRRVFVPALVFAVFMGLSRIYLMVHYPTDVLAGAVIGLACGLAAVQIWKKLSQHIGRKKV